MTSAASFTGASIFILIGIVMIFILFRNYKSKSNGKLLTPSNCLLFTLTVVSFVIATIFFSSSSSL
ncbi:hypothetical protein D5396_12605 [Rahnella inusitata]|uniref:LPXTG cell wall anchor domain-containing protein n=1 Tax=Rahnella inusitata TaxID=58169 RepID=A0ABX9P123_9GAMM|nr:hypothetical protein D5396_12605 [Rahnella inusitata]